MEASSKPEKSIFRFLRWRDLIVILLGLAIGWRINHGSFREPTDYQKWQARAPIDARDGSTARLNAGQTGRPPCFFLVSKHAIDQPVLSGSVGDCLLLMPGGKKLDLVEIFPAGRITHIKTDLSAPDVIPIAFTRCVITLDDWRERNEILAPHVYDPFLTGDRLPYTYLDWSLPDGESIHYLRISPGTGFADAIYQAKSSDSVFEGSKVKWNGWGWDLSLSNGTTFLSPEAYNATRPQQGSLVAIFDAQGHEVRMSRKSSGALTEIAGPNGGWIKLDYHGDRLVQARNNAGETAQYEYDNEDRLIAVRYAAASWIKYSYDSSNRLTGIEDSSLGTKVEAGYNSSGMVEQVTIDGEAYRFRHLVDDIDMTDPKGTVTRVHVVAKDGTVTYTVAQIAQPSSH